MKLLILTQHEPFVFTSVLYDFVKRYPRRIEGIIRIGQRRFGEYKRRKISDSIEKLLVNFIIFGPLQAIKGYIFYIYNSFLLFLNHDNVLLGEKALREISCAKDIPFICIPHDIGRLENILKGFNIDIVWNQTAILLDKRILEIPKIGIFNAHHSLLPRHKGRMPSFWSFMDEPPEYGVTVHFLTKEIDSGPVLLQEKIFLPYTVSYPEVIKYFKKHVPQCVSKALLMIDKGNLMVEEQEKIDGRANLCISLLKR